MTITFLASPYYTSGRQGAKITDIVLHWMVGTLATTDAEFTHGSRHVSAHYGIEDGTVHQYVKDGDTAWHAGDHVENTRSIGIEHSAAPGRPATALTIATSVTLIVALARKYGISPDHIYPHNKFYPTACPGTLPIADIIARVRAQLTTPTPEVPMTPTEKQEIADLTVHTLLVTQLGSTGPNVAVALQTAAGAGVAPASVAAIAAAVVALLPAGGSTVTAAQIAKAVNDDAAKRLLS